MKLTDLIKHVSPLEIKGEPAVEITSLGFNSTEVTEGQLFFALRGEKTDGHRFIADAVAKGAVAVVCERAPDDVCVNGNAAGKVPFITVANSHIAMGKIASAFYGHPSRRLQLTGITGTNGKTTTATLLYRMFRAAGYKSGLLSTITNYIDDVVIPATHTTEDAITLNKHLAEMVRKGCSHCFMEVSSHAIVQERIAGLHFAGALFSNITHDHLDYHKTFGEYLRAKKQFFDNLPETAFAVVNIDDKNGRVMVQNTRATVKTCALHEHADFNGRIIEMSFEGMHLEIDRREVWTLLTGGFNASNLLLVYAAARELGMEKETALRGVSVLQPVPGRFEKIYGAEQTERTKSPFGGANSLTVIVDYAHTPDALQNVLQTINQIRIHQPLITVVGCGGNRDTAKRPVMAAIAVNHSDKVIFTSDNPRFESPEAILANMKAGVSAEQLKNTLFITDRREAIRTALLLAQPAAAVVLIAGKGHETYQEINGEKNHFDDRETARELLHQLYD